MHHPSQNVTKLMRTCFNICQELCQQRQSRLLAVRRQQHQQQQQHTLSAATCVINTCRMDNFTSRQTLTLTYQNYRNFLNLKSFPLMVPASTYSKFTAACEPPNLGSIPLCEERAHDLISNLKDSERVAIKTALAKYEAMKLKEGFEGKLAATQWRTRFGRPSRVPAPTLGDVDPTGTYCAFPDDWLKKKAVERAKEPARADLLKIFMVNAVPFVGFGFLDNFTMIIAGDYIEQVFSYFMCISTMAAAGLGNTISDILGIGSAFYVERGCEMLGLKPPDLTPWQLELKSSRRAANYGRMIGITVGCLLGMTPLLFMDRKNEDKEAAEKKAEKKSECKAESSK